MRSPHEGSPTRPIRGRTLAAWAALALGWVLPMTGCQVEYAGMTLPSGKYMHDDVQYFPPALTSPGPTRRPRPSGRACRRWGWKCRRQGRPRRRPRPTPPRRRLRRFPRRRRPRRATSRPPHRLRPRRPATPHPRRIRFRRRPPKRNKIVHRPKPRHGLRPNTFPWVRSRAVDASKRLIPGRSVARDGKDAFPMAASLRDVMPPSKIDALESGGVDDFHHAARHAENQRSRRHVCPR